MAPFDFGVVDFYSLTSRRRAKTSTELSLSVERGKCIVGKLHWGWKFIAKQLLSEKKCSRAAKQGLKTSRSIRVVFESAKSSWQHSFEKFPKSRFHPSVFSFAGLLQRGKAERLTQNTFISPSSPCHPHPVKHYRLIFIRPFHSSSRHASSKLIIKEFEATTLTNLFNPLPSHPSSRKSFQFRLPLKRRLQRKLSQNYCCLNIYLLRCFRLWYGQVTLPHTQTHVRSLY